VRLLLLLLSLSSHPLLEQARQLEQKGDPARAWQLYLEAYTRTPDQRSGVEALFGAARSALAAGDTLTARGLVLRVLRHPLPVPEILQQALLLHLRLTSPEARWDMLRAHPEWMPLVPPESLWQWRTALPETLTLWWGTWGRSLDPGRRNRWKQWMMRRLRTSTDCRVHLILARWAQRDADTAWARICEGDTLAAVWWARRQPRTPSLDRVLHDWARRHPTRRCLPWGSPDVSCDRAASLLDTLARWVQAGSTRADSLLRWMQRSGRYPSWMLTLWARQLRRPWPDETFLPLVPPPHARDSLLQVLPSLDDTTLLHTARRLGLYDLGWRPPAGSSRVDVLLFRLHLLRYRRDTLWHRPPSISPDTLLRWALRLGSAGFLSALRLALVQDRFPLPFRTIPLRKVPVEDRIRLARWMGRHHLLKDLPTLLRTLPRKDDRRRARFWAYLEAGNVDSAFRFLDPKRPEEVLAQARRDPEIRKDLLALLHLDRSPRDTAILRLWLAQDTLPDGAAQYAFRALPPSLLHPLHRRLAWRALEERDRERFLRHALVAADTDSLLQALALIWLDGPHVAASFAWTLPDTLWDRLPAALQRRLRAWFPDRLPPSPASDSAASPSPPDTLAPTALDTSAAVADTAFPPSEQWERRLLASPAFLDRLFREAHRRYRAQDWDGARALWTFAARHPWVPRKRRAEALYRLGVLAKNTEDTLQAIRDFQTLMERYPDSPRWSDAAFQLAYLYLDRGKVDAALRVYDRLRGQPATREEEAERLYWEMQSWYRKKAWKRGILLGWLLWERYRTAGDWATTAALETARMYTLLGNLTDARRLLDAIVRVRGEKDELGRLAVRERNTLQTLQELRRSSP